jgi:hypothetical protein
MVGFDVEMMNLLTECWLLREFLLDIVTFNAFLFRLNISIATSEVKFHELLNWMSKSRHC